MICSVCKKWRSEHRGDCTNGRGNIHDDHFSECAVSVYPQHAYDCTCYDESPEI